MKIEVVFKVSQHLKGGNGWHVQYEDTTISHCRSQKQAEHVLAAVERALRLSGKENACK